MELQKKQNPSFTDYIYILYKWRKFLLISISSITIIATIYAFLLPKEYKATSVVMIAPDNSMGLSGLTGLLSGKSSSMNLGSKLLGVSNTSEDVLLGILNSRTALLNTIEKFDLFKYYEIDDRNMDKVLKAFSNDLSFGPNEYGMIEISVINKDPKRSADIANYFVEILDSLNIEINIEQAKNNRSFIEKRYLKNLSDLKAGEDSLYKIQKKYGVFAIPEQLEVAIKAAGEYELEFTKKELESYFTKQMYGENSPQYKAVKIQEDLLKSKIVELKKADKLTSESNVLFPFKEIPNIALQYLRNYREVEIQSKILEVILPLYEQAKVEEQKSIPTIMPLDKAVPPQLKYRPQKVFIILAFFFVSFFIFTPLVYRMEKVIKKIELTNPLEEKEFKFYLSVKKIFKVG